MSPLIETWSISHRMNELLLKGIEEAFLGDVAGKSGRNVGEQLAHIHNVRLMWLQASAPELMRGQSKIEKGHPISKKLLLEELNKSASAIEQLLKLGFDTGRIKGFKPHPEAFLGYLISHESHHRGQVILSLKLNSHLPDKKILYGLWEWGVH
jgi:uncharacterized damage-inducible protein DinB